MSRRRHSSRPPPLARGSCRDSDACATAPPSSRVRAVVPSQRRTLRRTAGPGPSCPQLLQAGDRVVVRRTLRRSRWRRNSLCVCLASIVRRLPDSRRLLLAGQWLVGLATADASRDGGGGPGHHCGSADCSYHSTSSSTWHQATLDEIDERRGCLTREWLIEFDQEPVDRAQLADLFGHRRLHRSDSGGARTWAHGEVLSTTDGASIRIRKLRDHSQRAPSGQARGYDPPELP